MTEQHNTDQPQAAKQPCCQRASIAKKLTLGAALVALPLGVYGIYRNIEDAAQPKDVLPRKGANLDAAMRQVDPALINYHEVTRIDTGFQSPLAIAVDAQGNLLVAAERTVRRFSRSGSLIGDISIALTPYCLASDNNGGLLVGMKDHVEVYGPDGKLAKTWPSFGEKSYLTCIAVAGNDVWVADAGRRAVVHCDRDGKILGEIAKADPARNLPGLQLPSPHLDVAVDPDGLIWVNNTGLHRLEAYKPDGTLDRFWGTPGTTIQAFPGCCNPADFAILKDGSFITAEKITPRVKRYLPDGTFAGVVAAPDLFGQNMTGIDVATDADGRVLLMERGHRIVRVFVMNEATTR